MSDFWRGKRVLITGGSAGLGRALALELSERGARVAIIGRRAERLDEAVAAARPREHVDIRADVAAKREIHRIAAEAHARLGGVDVLINNASALGPTPLRPLIDGECEDFESVLQSNLLGPYRLTKALLPGMLLRRNGVVLNLSSDAAANAYPDWGFYGTSKSALAHLSRIWDAELKDTGVRVLAEDPGDMDTEMHRAALPDADRTKLQAPRDAALRLIARLEAAHDRG